MVPSPSIESATGWFALGSAPRRFVGGFTAFCQTRLKFLNAPPEFFHFVGARLGSLRSVSRKKVANELDRIANDPFRIRETSLHGVLGLLVKVDRAVQIPRQEIMSGFVRGPDELRQKLHRQSDFAVARILHDDLGQDNVGEVFARTRIHHANVNSIADHTGDILELDVPAGVGVIEPAVAVFADENFGVFHRILQEKGAKRKPTKNLKKELDTAVQ